MRHGQHRRQRGLEDRGPRPDPVHADRRRSQWPLQGRRDLLQGAKPLMSTWKKPPAVPGSVLEVLRTGVQGKIKEPNLAEVAQHFVDMIGGERQLAKMLVDQYRHVETPQSVKTKIMQIVLGHIKTLNDKSGVIEELGLVTDEDLE